MTSIVSSSPSSNTPSQPLGCDVVFEGVTKSFGSTQVLRTLNMELKAGELVTVLGPSGCGKTTALRILAGFETASTGRILINGEDVTEVPANRRGIGMVFQAYSLFPNLSVQDNVEYGLRVRKVARDKRSARARELLEICGLGPFADRYPHQLSGGQQQRVALARALATQPSVLLLDEPLSALDAIVRVQMREEIRRLQQSLGITTMFVTHDQEEALAIADRVAVLKGGVIEQLADPQTLYHRPATEFVARFVGGVTEVGVPSSFQQGAFEVRGPGSGLDTLFIRPENIEFHPNPQGSSTVVSQIFTGERTFVRAVSDIDKTEVVSSASSSAAARTPVGTRVEVNVIAEPALRLSAGTKG